MPVGGYAPCPGTEVPLSLLPHSVPRSSSQALPWTSDRRHSCHTLPYFPHETQQCCLEMYWVAVGMGGEGRTAWFPDCHMHQYVGLGMFMAAASAYGHTLPKNETTHSGRRVRENSGDVVGVPESCHA